MAVDGGKRILLKWDELLFLFLSWNLAVISQCAVARERETKSSCAKQKDNLLEQFWGLSRHKVEQQARGSEGQAARTS